MKSGAHHHNSTGALPSRLAFRHWAEHQIQRDCWLTSCPFANRSNAINGTNVYVIYAQTPKFSISGDDCTDPTPIGAEPSTCAPPATVTVTVSKTLSRSNSTATATGGISAAQQVTPTPAVVTQVTTVYQGVCPDTIGWSAGYNHPVTLTKPPRAPNSPEPTGSFGGADDNVKTVYRTTYLPLELAPTACGC